MSYDYLIKKYGIMTFSTIRSVFGTAAASFLCASETPAENFPGC